MNSDEIDFDQITPEANTRPEHCRVCNPDEEEFFGRLNFRSPRDLDWPVQFCPMHNRAIAEGKVSKMDTALVFTGGKVG